MYSLVVCRNEILEMIVHPLFGIFISKEQGAGGGESPENSGSQSIVKSNDAFGSVDMFQHG